MYLILCQYQNDTEMMQFKVLKVNADKSIMQKFAKQFSREHETCNIISLAYSKHCTYTGVLKVTITSFCVSML